MNENLMQVLQQRCNISAANYSTIYSTPKKLTNHADNTLKTITKTAFILMQLFNLSKNVNAVATLKPPLLNNPSTLRYFKDLNGNHVKDISFECGNVFLTISSLWKQIENSRELIDTEIELNWDTNCENNENWLKPNKIKLFENDPNQFPSLQPLYELDISNSKIQKIGYFRTNISFGKPLLPGGWNKHSNFSRIIYGPHCFPYWIASFANSKLLKSACLKIEPTWMGDNRERFGNSPLSLLLIPGTHDAGAFSNEPKMQRKDLFLNRYLLTQDRDIWTQLVHGIRYLDFRIGYYGSLNDKDNITAERNYWLNHDIVRISPLLPLLLDIKKFLLLAKDEVVILDIHRFPVGFMSVNRHHHFVSFLRKVFGNLILSPKDCRGYLGPTLNEIHENKLGRLIISYSKDTIALEYDWLWPPLPQLWGNQQTAHGLRSYISKVMDSFTPTPIINSHFNPFWAVMAEMTPTKLDVLLNIYGNLRIMADDVNRNLTTWVRQKWWKTANIIATDYFLGNNLINVAIASNIN